MTKKIFKSIMTVCTVVFVIGLAFVMGILYRYFGKQISAELEKEAAYVAQGVESSGMEYLEKLNEKNARITLIDQDGSVLYDSQAEASSMENHEDREEVKEAAETGKGKAVRMSETLSEKTIYYALRLEDGRILRVSSTQYSALALVYQLIVPVLWILLLMIILSGVFASRLSKKVVEPVNNLDLEHPEENEIYEEVAPLLSRMYKQNREIKNQIDTARRQQEEFSIITENMQEGLVVIDRYTMILSGNSSVWKLFHVSEPKSGESVYVLNRSEEFQNIIDKALDGKHNEAVLKVDGSDIHVIANPVMRDNQVEGAVLLLVNVTEKLEREKLRREFSANVSHELKTPLTSISGFAEIIQDGYVKEEDIRAFAGRIYKEAQRLITLVEDVIRISQLDEGEVPYEWTDVDLYQTAKNVFGTLSEAAKKHNVHLYIEGDRVHLHTVSGILEEVLFNLCDNAIKYNKQDGSVCVRLTENEENVCISVKDNGVGIPKEDQSRVFERFYRVDKSHSKEIGGTGLGLSIVKHGVSFLGGEVGLESIPGQGTEITVKFPKE
ncbi:MAG: ATP-binding protein [Eubacteriales bacterium]|nr:ATP-binding protein [Eubacteriales bacterium]